MTVRFTELSDEPHLHQWLQEPGVLRNFAMGDPLEVEDGAKRWVAYARYRCSLTVDYNGVPAGIGTLWLNPYRKMAHQCQFGMIVAKEYRRKGVGTILLNNLLHLAKNYFNIELIHLEAYESNPALTLYRRFGFKEFGRQEKFLKDNGRYYARILMEREL